MSNLMLVLVIILTLFAGLGLTAYVVYKLGKTQHDTMEVNSARVILIPISVLESLEGEIKENRVEIQCLRDRLTSIELAISAGSDSEIIRVIKNGTNC